MLTRWPEWPKSELPKDIEGTYIILVNVLYDPNDPRHDWMTGSFAGDWPHGIHFKRRNIFNHHWHVWYAGYPGRQLYHSAPYLPCGGRGWRGWALPRNSSQPVQARHRPGGDRAARQLASDRTRGKYRLSTSSNITYMSGLVSRWPKLTGLSTSLGLFTTSSGRTRSRRRWCRPVTGRSSPPCWPRRRRVTPSPGWI